MDQVHSELSLRQLSRREGLALATISLCALVLLAALQHDRVFLGDLRKAIPATNDAGSEHWRCSAEV